MFEEMTEEQARQRILEEVKAYSETFCEVKEEYKEGDRISYAGRVFDNEEMVNLVDSSLDFWLTAGRYTEQFERGLAEYLGVHYCSLVNSGSSANLVAFMTLTSPQLGKKRIQKGDEVITVAAGFPTTIAPIIQYGAVPVFVDVDIPQYNIRTDMLEKALSEKTKAVFIAHTLGNPFDLKVVKAFCDSHNLWLIEDNCDALGSEYMVDGAWRKTGTIGHIGTSSFYPPHHMTMGEGGAVYTNDPQLYKIINSFRDWGRDCFCRPGQDGRCNHRYDRQYGELPLGYDHKYVYSHFGYNLKATDMQAAIGCAQLKKLDGFTEKRRENWKFLRESLEEVQNFLILPEAEKHSNPSWFGFLMTVKEDAPFTRDEFSGYLEENNIQTRNLFAGNIIKHPCFDEMRETGEGYRVVGDLCNTDVIMNNSVWIGVYPGMSRTQQQYMIEKILRFVRAHAKKTAEKDYLQMIQSVRETLNEENVHEMIQILDEAFKIKPVRAIWFVAKAEAMYKAGCRAEEINDLLKEKYCLLYDYENVCDIIEIYIKLAEDSGDAVEKSRMLFVLNSIQNNPKEEGRAFVRDTFRKTNVLYDAFLEGDISEELFGKIMEQCYIQQELVLYLLFDSLVRKLSGRKNRVRDWVEKLPNTGYLKEKVDGSNQDTFIVAADEESDMHDCEVAAKLLNMLGKKVFFIGRPIRVEVEYAINMVDTVQVSMDNVEINGNQTFVRPVEIICKDKRLGDNRDYIIDYINKIWCAHKHSVLICSGELMEDLWRRDILRKQMGRLYNFREEFTEQRLTFGWTGDYLDYISGIYEMDAREAVEKLPECDFSIVIPVRNSAETLRDTLKTCLEQSYKGSYEIVISDNSTMKGSGIYELCQEMNDSRIVYLKTPRDLSLSKSFEYAYLHTKGEYVFSLGADDGVLPWALEMLAEVTKIYPEEEVIKWDRGFYAWPGFNGGQENQLTSLRSYQKGEYETGWLTSENYITTVLIEPQRMYGLPLLYINSCFKRSYMETLLQKTGRLWDGSSQDIYMGIVTAAIRPRTLNLIYPLTIAGMSSTSIGKNSADAKKSNQELDALKTEVEKTNNIGGTCYSSLEHLIPEMGTDVYALYNAILRAVTIGIIPEFYLTEVFDWKKIFKRLSVGVDCRDLRFDRIVQEMRYNASKQGSEFLEWFDETIYQDLMMPKCIDEDKVKQLEKQKTYVTGKNEAGGFIVDALEYGVKNVYDATKLFVKLSEL